MHRQQVLGTASSEKNHDTFNYVRTSIALVSAWAVQCMTYDGKWSHCFRIDLHLGVEGDIDQLQTSSASRHEVASKLFLVHFFIISDR